MVEPIQILSGEAVASRISQVDARFGSLYYDPRSARQAIDGVVDALRGLPSVHGVSPAKAQDWAGLVEAGVRSMEQRSARLGHRPLFAAASFGAGPHARRRVLVVTKADQRTFQETDPVVAEAIERAERENLATAVSLLRTYFAAEAIAPGAHPLNPVGDLFRMGTLLGNPDGQVALLRESGLQPLDWTVNPFSPGVPGRLRVAVGAHL